MATLYWRGAVNNSVQIPANWTLFRPGLSASAPPAALAGPTAGDSVIFADFVDGGWNPVFSPYGLIGGVTLPTVLNTLTVEDKFKKDVGSFGSNFLQVYASNIYLNKGVWNSSANNPTNPPRVFVKSLNQSCGVYLSPGGSTSPVERVDYILSGLLNKLYLYAPSSEKKCDIYLGVYDGTDVGISGGIITNSATYFDYTMHIGKRATIGGLNVIGSYSQNNVSSLYIQRGVSLDNLTLNAVNGRISINFTEAGATYGETGALGNQTFINNFNINADYTAPITPSVSMTCTAGVSFENFNISGYAEAYINPSWSSGLFYIKNFKYTPHPWKTDYYGLPYPKISGYAEKLVIGAADEVGGGSIESPLGFTYSEKPANITLTGNVEIDIV